jgi:hypothetical protein
MKKNRAAVALGKLAASGRTKEELAEAGRRGGLKKAANRANGNAPTFAALVPGTDFAQPTSQTKKRKPLNGTAAALETETELAESTSQTKKRNA